VKRFFDKGYVFVLLALAVAVAIVAVWAEMSQADNAGTLDGSYAIGDASSKDTAEVDTSGNLQVSRGKAVTVTDVTTAAGLTNMLVSGTGPAAAVYTKAINLTNGIDYALAYQFAGTSPQILITVEQSYKVPTTEGAADADYILPTGLTTWLANTGTGTTLQIIPLTTDSGPRYILKTVPYLRFKLIGAGSNPVGAGTGPTARLRILQIMER